MRGPATRTHDGLTRASFVAHHPCSVHEIYAHLISTTCIFAVSCRYYDTWHTARPSTLPCTLHIPPEERDPLQTRFFCKFRWWRMEEPTGPSWSTLAADNKLLASFAPPVDTAFPTELRITPASQAIYAYLAGYSFCRDGSASHISSESGESQLQLLGAAEPTPVLLERLGWYSEAFACALDEKWRGPSPPNPCVVNTTGQPAMLASLCAAYEPTLLL